MVPESVGTCSSRRSMMSDSLALNSMSSFRALRHASSARTAGRAATDAGSRSRLSRGAPSPASASRQPRFERGDGFDPGIGAGSPQLALVALAHDAPPRLRHTGGIPGRGRAPNRAARGRRPASAPPPRATRSTARSIVPAPRAAARTGAVERPAAASDASRTPPIGPARSRARSTLPPASRATSVRRSSSTPATASRTSPRQVGEVDALAPRSDRREQRLGVARRRGRGARAPAAPRWSSAAGSPRCR